MKAEKQAQSIYKKLWESGELVKVAKGCKSASEVAAKFGVSVDALVCGLQRLRRDIPKLPTLKELIGKQSRSYEQLKKEIVKGMSKGVLPKIPTDAQRADFAYGNTKLSNDAVTKEMAEEAVRKEKEKLNPVDEHRLKRKLRELEQQNKELMETLVNTKDTLEVLKEAANYKIPPLEPREKTSGLQEGCSLVCISDTHLDEVVTLESVNGLNEYNPDIARKRMEKLFQGANWLTNFSRQANLVKDVVIWLGGDIISGTIHEDLRETNAMSLPESIAFAHQIISDGLNYLLEDKQTEHIRVVCSTGNHGRLTPKMRVHTRNETNIETLLYLNLAREFKNNERISFDLPAGELTYFDVYGRTVRVFHGDALKYGGSLGGLTNPINRAISKWDQGRASDLSIMGHWHTYLDGGRWIVNGSVISTSAYSVHIAAPHERPQQAWALLDSKRWRSLSAPIFCSDE